MSRINNKNLLIEQGTDTRAMKHYFFFFQRVHQVVFYLFNNFVLDTKSIFIRRVYFNDRFWKQETVKSAEVLYKNFDTELIPFLS